MGKQYKLGQDDNVLDAYGVRFTIVDHTHYLDTNRIKLLERDIALGRLILTGAADIDDSFLGLPEIDLYLVDGGTTPPGGGTTGPVEVDAIEYTSSADGTIRSVKDALDKLLYVPVSISNFYVNTPILEKGQVSNEQVLNWSINKGVVSQTINTNSVLNTSRTITLNDSVTSNKTYTLEVNDGKNVVSKQASITFASKRYWGVSANPNINDAQMLLLNKEFATAKSKSFILNGNGEYIYFAYPESFGDAVIKVNGLNNTAWTKTVRDFNNASGFTESYIIYNSDTVQNGINIEIQVV